MISINIDYDEWVVNIHGLLRGIFDTVRADEHELRDEGGVFAWYKRAGNVTFFTREAPIVEPQPVIDHLDNLAR